MTKTRLMVTTDGNEQLLRSYLAYARMVRKRSPNTLHCYAKDLGLLAEWAGHRDLRGLSTADLGDWLGRPRSTPSGVAAPMTIKREMMELRSFYRWMVEHAELASRNPAAKLVSPRVDNENPRPVEPAAWRAVWAHGGLGDDERVALGLAFFCGLRRHEVTLLSPAQVDLKLRVLVDVKRKGHTKSKIRWGSCVDMFEARMPDAIGAADSFIKPLERLVHARQGELTLLPWDPPVMRVRYASRTAYGRPVGLIDPLAFNRRLNGVLERTGVSPRFTPHQCRHSFATNMLAMGVDVVTVSRLAGHSDLAVTMRYLKAAEDPLADLLAADGLGMGGSAPRASKWGE